MMLAARIQDALKAKNMKKGELATALNKQPSEISKWLSGTHNFTAETLWDIGDVLEIDLISLEDYKKEKIVYMGTTTVSQNVNQNNYLNISDYSDLLVAKGTMNLNQFQA
ncbi:MAG TPA: hypothetical protein DCG75_02620 [Bacteroidales bacterium]|nr:hypothetical protein [Bacteroidales bacterium]